MGTNSIEKQQSDVQTFESLCLEFRKYINELETKWKQNNRPPQFKDVLEVLRPDERAQIESYCRQWDRYVTPIAEEWWRERGYGVNWPDDNSQPVGYYKL